jgi:hypothetical protein
MKHSTVHRSNWAAAVMFCTAIVCWERASAQVPDADGRMDPAAARVIEHWTRDRRARALPRDLRVDSAGRAYLRGPDGALEPYGRQLTVQERPAAAVAPLSRPQGSGASSDGTPPSISGMDPASGAVIGSTYTFSAKVTDDSGVRSVSFIIRYPDGTTTQTFSASAGANDVWSVTLQGFFDGDWSWRVEARDGAKKGGNTATSDPVSFTVDTGSGGGATSGTDTISNSEWVDGGTVRTAAGRLYFEMPSNSRWKGPWTGYVCSGTVVTDETGGRSVILTAAHCVYDDANRAFARNVLFIPDQTATTGSGTDLNCDNDWAGCWVPSFGTVDVNWTTRTFPDNVAWDYAYYVVPDSGAHAGAASSSDSLEVAAGGLAVSFSPPYHDDGAPGAQSIDFTHALGYSYSDDPKLMYCAEDMTTQGADDWWLGSCGLSGGASGGPWLQPLSGGDGPIVSVNSWGYTNSPGMAGPKLSGTSAECVFTMAKSLDWSAVSGTDGYAGSAVACQ